MKRLLLFLVLLAALSFAGPRIKIENPWIMEPPPGPGTTMMGMVVVNEGDEEDYLVGASSDVARIVEIHRTVMQNGVARMEKQDRVRIPPGSRVEFRHHGYHIMLIGLDRKLKAGDRVRVKLHFKKSGTVEVEVPVVRFHEGEHEHKHEHHHHHHENMREMKEEKLEIL